MATFRLHRARNAGADGAGSGAFWVNTLTQERARALLARTFESGSGPDSEWLDASRTVCLHDRRLAVPRGVICIGSLRRTE